MYKGNEKERSAHCVAAKRDGRRVDAYLESQMRNSYRTFKSHVRFINCYVLYNIAVV